MPNPPKTYVATAAQRWDSGVWGEFDREDGPKSVQLLQRRSGQAMEMIWAYNGTWQRVTLSFYGLPGCDRAYGGSYGARATDG